LKGVDGIQKPVGGWQRDLIDEVLCRGDGAPVERSDSACERIDETVQFRIREGTIDVPVALGCVPVEIIAAENYFEGATAADQVRQTFGASAARMQAHCDFGLAKPRVLARCEAHVAREDELAACAAHASADFRDTDDRRLRGTHERIQKYRETGGANAGHDIAQLAGQVKVGKVKIRNCAFK